MSDPFESIRAHIADTLAELQEHKRSQHTPEYEAYLRALPWRPWHPTQRLQVSSCDICQTFFEMIVDAQGLLPPDPITVEAALAAVRPADSEAS